MCVTACPQGKELTRKINDSITECVAECTGDTPFKQDTECVANCDLYHEENGVNVCDSACPSDKPYQLYEDEDTMECVEECPSEFKWVTGDKCGKSCAEQQYTVEIDTNDVSINRCLTSANESSYQFFIVEELAEGTYKRRFTSC